MTTNVLGLEKLQDEENLRTYLNTLSGSMNVTNLEIVNYKKVVMRAINGIDRNIITQMRLYGFNVRAIYVCWNKTECDGIDVYFERSMIQ